MNSLATLILIVCLRGDAHACRPVVAPLDPSMAMGGFLACMGIAGQEQAAKYEEEHPKYFVRRFSCKFGQDADRGA